MRRVRLDTPSAARQKGEMDTLATDLTTGNMTEGTRIARG